jgi:N-hydroxyarylamine O-acetyltransferase
LPEDKTVGSRARSGEPPSGLHKTSQGKTIAGTPLVAQIILVLFSRPMDAADFPLSLYLARIGLTAAPDPNEEGLRKLHAAQAFSIPFENLDIHLGRTISLEPDALVSKIIRRGRGGYCFELNGIFHLALRSLGFAVRPLLARVLYGRSDPGARTHQVLIVTISGRDWLADIGFGGPGLRLPLPLIPGQVEKQYRELFRLRSDPKYGIVLQKESNDAFVDLYAFDEDELTLDIDIDMANHFTSTWPDSIFRLHRMCSLPKSWGRTTLSDMELTIHRDGQSISRTLPSGPQYMAAIAEHFGICLDAAYESLAPLSQSQGPTA